MLEAAIDDGRASQARLQTSYPSAGIRREIENVRDRAARERYDNQSIK